MDSQGELMRVVRVRIILWATAVLGAMGTVAGVLAALTMPLDGAIPPSAKPSLRAQATFRPGHELPPLSSFEQAWRVPLRRPLVDPPPVLATGAQPARPPGPSIRLVGTIVDERRPRGVFLVGLNGIELRGVGEKAGGAEVLSIGENAATLSSNGQTFTLKRDKSPFDPTGATPAAAVLRTGPDDGS